MSKCLSTGINGLDTVLYGGFPKGSPIILEGAPGTGKTTLGMQFLYKGITDHNEPGIYITFEELPEQLYKDMQMFGWDLRLLERQRKLRIVCMSPEVLLAEMLEPDGLFERIVQEIGCKRVVIDSINLFQYGLEQQEKHRETIYLLRNTLRKFSLSTLLIREQTRLDKAIVPFEHYVADGVIRLSLQEQFQKFRKRTLEVLKMRGSKMMEGEHIYRITDEGIHLLPARSMVEDVSINDEEAKIPTGIQRLDEQLSGGIKNGSVFLLDTNSKANYKYLLASIISNQVLASGKMIVLPSSLTSIYDFQHMLRLFDVELSDYTKENSAYIIEFYNRLYPDEINANIIDVSGLDHGQYYEKMRKELRSILQASIRGGDRWFMYYDLNTIFSAFGKDVVVKFFAEETARARAAGLTILALCNFAELDDEVASFLERTSNGVIRTWVDGSYQYLQVTKSPDGRMSEPLILENISEKPFVRLV